MDNHNVIGNDRRDGLKMSMYMAISSQVTLRGVEGSTTRLHSLSEMMKAQECAATQGLKI